MQRVGGIQEVNRRVQRLATARIVMVTTETDLPRVVEALQSGADEYVMKPFTKESIFAKLALLGIEI